MFRNLARRVARLERASGRSDRVREWQGKMARYHRAVADNEALLAEIRAALPLGHRFVEDCLINEHGKVFETHWRASCEPAEIEDGLVFNGAGEVVEIRYYDATRNQPAWRKVTSADAALLTRIERCNAALPERLRDLMARYERLSFLDVFNGRFDAAKPASVLAGML